MIMLNLIAVKPLYPAFISLFCLLVVGCSSPQSASKCGPCPLYAQIEPNISFRVVDRTTGQDLFFGTAAPYKPGQLKMYHLINGKPDTAFLQVDNVNNYFRIFVAPVHRVDTVTMQIANLSRDILLFETTLTGDCCPRLNLASVSYNGTVVYTAANGPGAVVLPK